MSESIEEEVLSSARRLFEDGLVVGTAGNVSGKKSPEEILITPSSIPYETMQLDDLVCLSLDGTKISGKHPPSTESQIHLECYKAYPEVGGVIHSHPKYASMFAVSQMPVPALIEEVIVYVGGDIEPAKYHKTGSAELAEHLAGELTHRSAVLMSNHGLLCIGKSAAEALKATQIVERTAEIAQGAKALNQSPQGLPQSVVEEFQSVYAFVREQMWK